MKPVGNNVCVVDFTFHSKVRNTAEVVVLIVLLVSMQWVIARWCNQRQGYQQWRFQAKTNYFSERDRQQVNASD